MKNIISWKVLSFFAATLIFFAACEKDDMIKLDPQVVTWGITDITSTSAIVSGFVVAEGDGFIEHGVAWGTENDPTVDANTVKVDTVEKAKYTATITGLEYLTTYHVRAYTKDVSGTVYYGKDTTFTTLANVPALTIGDITNITDISASVAASVTNDGKAAVTAKGFCWGTEQNPTIENDTTVNGIGEGDFTDEITGLLGGTTYFVRAYAINEIGITYSDEKQFTTLAGLAVVTTDSVINVTTTTATVYGNAIYNSGADITERGICWSTIENPTISDDNLAAGTGLGSFSADLTGLSEGETYYARAYATNSEGTSYGDNIMFQTVANIITWNVPGGYVSASYPGGSYADWDPGASPQVISTQVNPTSLEGYIYMANANNEFKFATQNNWDGPNYGAGANAGELDPDGGNLILSDAGYYKMNVDISGSPYTYTAVATVWGVIGGATPGGWDSETALTYDPASRTWRGTVHMTADEFKFRANNDWGYNYGSSAGDETLDAGGSNIPVTVVADYDFTLDLSNPNNYTYSAYRWGLIGDATPGGWSDDTDMTWDNVNNVFTVILDLTVGEFKFRANDALTVNLGGDINALTQDGANISISTAGNYTITLNTMTNVATITQN